MEEAKIRSRQRRGLALLTGALALIACSGTHRPNFVRRPTTSIDVESVNLSAKEELDALLLGAPGLGRAEGTRRIAIPALEVRGAKDRGWLGEYVAESLATELSRVEGISVLERAQIAALVALKKGSPEVTAKGKLVGAEFMILGSVTAIDEERIHVSARAVRVEDGVLAGATEFDSTLDTLAGAAEAAANLAGAVGVDAKPAPAIKPLGSAAAKQAALALEAHLQGKLIEAQRLYRSALPSVTAAHRFEADYLDVMADLGMTEWVEDRAAKVLAATPPSPATACSRAIVLSALGRAKPSVATVRDAVRSAAACGDPGTIVSALSSYFGALKRVDVPLANEAVARARDHAKAPNAGAWARCRVGRDTLWHAANEGSGPKDLLARYKANRDECVAAGNLRVASLSARSAANLSFDPTERLRFLADAIQLLTQVSGRDLDDALLAYAREARSVGKHAEADDRILAVIGGRLKAIIALRGSLGDPELRLDSELLVRAGVSSTAKSSAAPAADEGTEFELKIHRRALGVALRGWSERTRAESQKQADFYADIADRLDPSSVSIAGEKGFERRLLDAKVGTLDSIATASGAPLRAYGHDAETAFYALWDYFWWARTNAKDRLPKIVAGARTLSTWLNSERATWNLARMEALAAADGGNTMAAKGALQAARAFAATHPTLAKLTADTAIEVLEKVAPSEVMAVAEERAKLAKELGPIDWVWAEDFRAARHAREKGDYVQQVDRLIAVVNELENRKAYEAAALALERAALLENAGQHAFGTMQAVGLYRRRQGVIAKLGDPLRLFLARADLLNAYGSFVEHTYRGSKKSIFQTDDVAIAIASDVAADARRLASEGRVRDAARIAARLDSHVPGVPALVDEALGWAKKFEDSAEYPVLVGWLHVNRARTLDDSGKRRAEFALARELLAKGGDMGNAIFQAFRVIQYSVGESEAWTSYNECVTLAGDHLDRVYCSRGLGAWLLEDRSGAMDAARARKALEHGLAAIGGWDAGGYAPAERMESRTMLAMLAAQAGDKSTFEKLHDEIRTYYLTTVHDEYQWSTHLSRVVSVVALADSKLAVRLAREFDESKGASTFWRGTQYVQFAQFAAYAGDESAEKYFLQQGKHYAIEAAPQWVPYYELHPIRDAVAKKNWKRVEEIYRASEQSIRKYVPNNTWWPKELVLYQATARAFAKNNAGALTLLAPLVAEARAALSTTPASPGLYTRVLELAAAIERASGKCKEAGATAADAASMRAKSVERVCHDKWCDGPAFATWKGANTCGKPLTVDTDLLRSW